MNDSQNNVSSEDLRFEYDKLRQEILQNDSLGLQVLGATLLVTSAIMGFAFSQVISQRPVRGIFFYTSIPIAFIGLLHNIDRVRGTFIIASYLIRFIEPKTQNIKWETRLKSFREESAGYGYHRLMSINLSYVVIAWLSCFLGTGYFLREIQQNSASYSQFILGIMWMIIILALSSTVGLTWFAKSQYEKYVTNYIKTYDEVWGKVEISEPQQ